MDDPIIASKDPLKYISQIEQEFALRNIEDSPKFYLGSDVSKKGNITLKKCLEAIKINMVLLKRKM